MLYWKESCTVLCNKEASLRLLPLDEISRGRHILKDQFEGQDDLPVVSQAGGYSRDGRPYCVNDDAFTSFVPAFTCRLG